MSIDLNLDLFDFDNNDIGKSISNLNAFFKRSYLHDLVGFDAYVQKSSDLDLQKEIKCFIKQNGEDFLASMKRFEQLVENYSDRFSLITYKKLIKILGQIKTDYCYFFSKKMNANMIESNKDYTQKIAQKDKEIKRKDAQLCMLTTILITTIGGVVVGGLTVIFPPSAPVVATVSKAAIGKGCLAGAAGGIVTGATIIGAQEVSQALQGEKGWITVVQNKV